MAMLRAFESFVINAEDPNNSSLESESSEDNEILN